MKLKFIYGILPALVFYTDNLPESFGGAANGPVVRIRPKYAADEGLHQHELTHVKQWYRTLGLHGLFYWLFQSYRLFAEIEAYRKQLECYNGDGIDWMAAAIHTKYNIYGYTLHEIKSRLEGY